MFSIVQKSVNGATMRKCAGLLSSYLCVPTSDNYVCASDLCNAAGRQRADIRKLLAAVILVVAAVARNIR